MNRKHSSDAQICFHISVLLTIQIPNQCVIYLKLKYTNIRYCYYLKIKYIVVLYFYCPNRYISHFFIFSWGRPFRRFGCWLWDSKCENGSNELQMRIVVEQYEYTSLIEEVVSIG